ncbi:MAG: DUF2330 domain-containing protein [Thermoplasmata archaeon]|nr:MAG: DUF2330 domain-containing protein [Thermoplasmata archaeon]
MGTTMKIFTIVFMCLFLLSSCLGGFTAKADRGSVVIDDDDINIYEPGQKAIICWDGTNELLILSTDIRAEEPTKALEIMPLPSEPEISTCDVGVFEKLKDLVELNGQSDEKGEGSYDRGDNLGPSQDVEIIFHEQLGFHDITVIKAHTTEGFAQYVSDFMVELGLEPMSFPEAEDIAESYMSRGYNYFVLDVIELSYELRSPEPLMYKFESDSLYYPMEITSLTGGESHILLFTLIPSVPAGETYEEKDGSFLNERTATYQDEYNIELSTPQSPVDFDKITEVTISTDDLKDEAEDSEGNIIDEDFFQLYDFFSGHDEVKVGVFEYDGPVEMKGDVEIKEYAVQKVLVDQEYEFHVWNLILVTVMPVIIFAVILFVVIWRTSSRS